MWADKYKDEYKGKKILVTGGAGAIGSNLCLELIRLDPQEIIILDDLSSSYEWNIPKHSRIRFIKGSILNDEILRHIFGKKVDYVFHLAAHFANQNSVENPETDLIINGLGTLRLLEYSQFSRPKRFVYASSGCGVYGLESKMPFHENDISISLYTPYQVTKLLGELYSKYFHNLYRLPIVNARFFNSFGPGEVPGRYRNVIPNFFFWAMQNEALPITGTGNETRDFTFVGDIVDGLLAMGIEERAIGEAINLGTSNETKIIDLAKEINRLTGNNAGVRYIKPRVWDKKKRLRASIQKAQNILGYKPRTDIRKGLKEVHNWFKKHWNEIKSSAEF